jgi:hypothetical protein
VSCARERETETLREWHENAISGINLIQSIVAGLRRRRRRRKENFIAGAHQSALAPRLISSVSALQVKSPGTNTQTAWYFSVKLQTGFAMSCMVVVRVDAALSSNGNEYFVLCVYGPCFYLCARGNVYQSPQNLPGAHIDRFALLCWTEPSERAELFCACPNGEKYEIHGKNEFNARQRDDR